MIGAHYENQEYEWQRTREIIAMIYNVNVKSSARLKSNKLIPLPSDKNKEVQKSTTEQFLEDCIRKGIKIPFPYDSPSGKKYR